MSHDTGVLNLIRNGRLANAAWKRMDEGWERKKEREREREKKMKAKWSHGCHSESRRAARRKRFSSRNKNREKRGAINPLDFLPLRRITRVHEGPEARILPHRGTIVSLCFTICFRTIVKQNGEVTTIDKRGWPRCLLCGFKVWRSIGDRLGIVRMDWAFEKIPESFCLAVEFWKLKIVGRRKISIFLFFFLCYWFFTVFF